ncbi:glycosyltransferase family 39 protein [Candidatus Margulisiibacteriota bacterium]
MKKAIALILAIIGCCIILFTLSDYGLPWDEQVYYLAGDTYVNWLKNPALSNIDDYWIINNEHPPFYKLLGGITKYIFYYKLNWFDAITAFRLANLFFVFAMLFFLFLFSCELYGLTVALFVTITFFFMPRLFYHAHIGALDYPIMTIWFLVCYSYWKGIKDQKWIIVSSLLLGLALLTKLNSFYLYLPLLFYWIIQGKKNATKKLLPLFWIPPIIFFAGWPYLWVDPLNRFFGYLNFHLGHVKIPVLYFAKQYLVAPWHYPFVLTLLTIPLIILIPFLIGLANFQSNQHKKTNYFILFNAFLPLIIIAMPNIPKYDGVRLFLPAFPFLYLLAGSGLNLLLSIPQNKLLKPGVTFIIIPILILATIYFPIIKLHPFQQTYYNELLGGRKGAVNAGFELEYWGSPYKELIPWMNKNSGSSYYVYIALNIFQAYQRLGLLNEKIAFKHPRDSNYLILLNRQGTYNKMMWHYYLNKKPIYSVKSGGLSLVNVYKLRD